MPGETWKKVQSNAQKLILPSCLFNDHFNEQPEDQMDP
jgi:hypothetical protein